MIKKTTLAVNAVLSCTVLLLAVIYLATGSLLSKAGASICFVMIGVLNFFLTRKALKELRTFSVLLLVGLFLAMAGDLAINHNFVAGAAAFAAGHIFFYAAQRSVCPRDKRSVKRDIICAAIVFFADMAVLMIAPLELRTVTMIVVCTFYAAIVSVMTGKAISNFIGVKTPFFLYMLIGTGLFMVSDLLLALYGFMGNIPVIHQISLSLYYISEIILADSFLMIAKEKHVL